MQYHQLDGAQLNLLAHVLFNMVFQLEEEKKLEEIASIWNGHSASQAWYSTL